MYALIYSVYFVEKEQSINRQGVVQEDVQPTGMYKIEFSATLSRSAIQN